MFKIKNNKKGMTIVEVLVGLAIMSILLFIVYSVYISNVKFIDKENIKTDLQNQAQLIDSSFSQLSMQSTGVVDAQISETGKENVYKVKRLVFNYPEKVKEENEEEKNEEYEYKEIQWIVNGNKLELKSEGNTHILSENINEFTIKPVGINKEGSQDNILEKVKSARVIKVKINLKKQKGFNTVEYPIELLVTFRNKTEQ